MNLITTLGRQAKAAARGVATAPTASKNRALEQIALALLGQSQTIIAANLRDLDAAREKALAAPLLDRLILDEARIRTMAEGIRQIAALPDPVGEITGMRTSARGLRIGRMRAPLGVIGIIYESRPNVTADAAALCLKSGNAAILRGGSEAILSNRAIMAAVAEGLACADLNPHTIQLIPDANRAHVTALLGAKQFVDVLIPRGGKDLVRLVGENAKMPVIKHLSGLCHLYVDKDADLDKALRIADNGKTYRYGICGATETLLVHRRIAAVFIPAIAARYREKGVEMRGCAKACALVRDIAPARDADWESEYLAPIISIRVVADYAEALAHIIRYGSRHTEAIATENLTTAERFLHEVDAASVMVNTPTCFADGYEYGLGAEIGISTDTLHWRGPVGLEGLTSRKFIVMSDGVTR